MDNREANKEANSHLADLLGSHNERRQRELEQLGAVEREPETDPSNPFDGGARETAPRIPESDAEVEEEHGDTVAELAMMAKQARYGA